MIKVMGLVQRLPEMELDAFRLHWRTIHRGLALRLAHADILKAYVQNHRLEIAVEGLIPFADGVPELWFEDLEDFIGMRDSVAFRDGAFHDGPRFMDVTNYASLVVDPELPVAAPSRRECIGALKAMFLLDEMPRDQIARAGRSVVLGEVAPVRLSYHVASPLGKGITDHPCVGVETSWWKDLPSFMEAWSRRLVPRVSGILAEERAIFWPGEQPPPADWSPVAVSVRQEG